MRSASRRLPSCKPSVPFFPAFQSALLPTFLLKLLRDRHQCLLILWQTAGQPAEKHARLGRITVLQHIVKQHSQLPTVSVSQHHNGRQRLRYAAEIALANMFLHQLQQGDSPMLHDVIVRHHRHVDQWKRTAIQRLRQLRVGKFIQPVEGKGYGLVAP